MLFSIYARRLCRVLAESGSLIFSVASSIFSCLAGVFGPLDAAAWSPSGWAAPSAPWPARDSLCFPASGALLPVTRRLPASCPPRAVQAVRSPHFTDAGETGLERGGALARLPSHVLRSVSEHPPETLTARSEEDLLVPEPTLPRGRGSLFFARRHGC